MWRLRSSGLEIARLGARFAAKSRSYPSSWCVLVLIRLRLERSDCLHADVVGSTKLVQKNETLAHERIQDTFQRFSETIGNHAGIAHEIRGDALVAEFARASDAVSASLEFQAINTSHNEQLSDDVRPVLRIGIAMGEVVVADNTVTGEGVVLAQRLEQLAEQGGVCIQGAALTRRRQNACRLSTRI